jgi:hypothetical protein
VDVSERVMRVITPVNAGATLGLVVWLAWSSWLVVSRQAAEGHSHGTPTCDARLAQVVCFGGRAQLLGGSLRWVGEKSQAALPLTLTAAGWWRQDAGSLQSANGRAEYRGRTHGGWLDAQWQVQPDWSVGLRLERLQLQHALNGPGALLIAQAARLTSARPAHRSSVQAAWQAAPWALLSLEAGQESVAGQRARFAMLRLILSHGWQLAGG